ncbi:MAG: response regulator [Burkholderiaceae bacterium]|nr:response regulator [Burkholderiaceae bacterium]
MRRLLLVDDEANVLSALQRAIRQCDFGEEVRVETFSDPNLALIRSREVAFDVVVADFRMPQMNGVEFLRAYKEIQADSVRLILSASTEFETLMSAINQAEVFRYLTKPWQQNEIKDVLALALVYRDELRENLHLFNELREQLGELTPQEREAQRLEAEEPGITKVNWGPDGSVHLD